ncbi:hypothetical protein HY439_00585 [Candidatus Microgenomates bacterium]|nr:hypothetical protein [Candidatus Microgenomates bacterium]
MATLEQLSKEIAYIKERNRRVELDKRWETSYTRRFLLATFTYLAIGFYLRVIDVADPWLNAIVPAIAFMLSTLTLPFFKDFWLKFTSKNTKNNG